MASSYSNPQTEEILQICYSGHRQGPVEGHGLDIYPGVPDFQAIFTRTPNTDIGVDMDARRLTPIHWFIPLCVVANTPGLDYVQLIYS
ncbi:hypothetical protein PoB_002517900 [Plakobranchus ocellatus]|uniref:Uncharacterized protein n=1 Tax=Plakobranchus ocellatus TaxID=259542 RepID=A0AAV3ZW77_9GAST|nr:hypothetical protein PoB_002517900 [Plakobranchus ocellatus]